MNTFFTHPATLVFLGGGIGSLIRYGIGQVIPNQFSGQLFPFGILAVNITASFVLGLVAGCGLGRVSTEPLRLLLGVGFCGGLSTFSSFSNDTLHLIQSGRTGAALLNISLNVVLCLLASAGGLALWQRI
jgi:fluoride exporter